MEVSPDLFYLRKVGTMPICVDGAELVFNFADCARCLIIDCKAIEGSILKLHTLLKYEAIDVFGRAHRAEQGHLVVDHPWVEVDLLPPDLYLAETYLACALIWLLYY